MKVFGLPSLKKKKKNLSSNQGELILREKTKTKYGHNPETQLNVLERLSPLPPRGL